MPNNQNKLPEIIMFAGPNDSGKSTITKFVRIIEPYINADDMMYAILCTFTIILKSLLEFSRSEKIKCFSGKMNFGLRNKLRIL